MAMPAGFLDRPLLQLTKADAFTLRDAVQGVCAMGGIGSGKTSGSGRALAHAYLRAGMGGLVLCAKPEEVDLWIRYCAEAGRSDSLIVLDGRTPILNFLAYELARQGGHGLNAVIELWMRVLEMARHASPAPGRQGEAFWEDTTRQVFRHAIPVLHAATGTVRMVDLLALVRSAPNSPEQMRDEAWQRQSPFFAMMRAAADRLDDATGERLMAYWGGDFAMLDPKTRGNIVISLTTALDRFNHGWLRDAFTTETTAPPELTFHGAVVVLAMPALTLNEDGIVAQQLYKLLWQRAVLARNGLPPEQQARPVFLWADECQYFVNSFDAEFLSTSRASLACTVFLTQSLPTLYAKLSHDGGHDRVHHLLGNFATRVWHNNACAETNEWAARTLGKSLQARANHNASEGTSTSYGMNMGEGGSWNRETTDDGFLGIGGFGWGTEPRWGRNGSEGGSDNWGRNRGNGTNHSVTHGSSEVMEYIIEPGQFGRMLKTGGPANGNRVSAVWYQAGRRFAASGGPSLLVEFAQ